MTSPYFYSLISHYSAKHRRTLEKLNKRPQFAQIYAILIAINTRFAPKIGYSCQVLAFTRRAQGRRHGLFLNGAIITTIYWFWKMRQWRELKQRSNKIN